jgi:recombination protein RecT
MADNTPSTVDTAPSPLRSVATLINSMRPEFARVLPATIGPDRLARIALTQIRNNRSLEACSPESLLGALMYCAELGLEPGVLDEVYLVAFGREVKLIIGYRGYIKLARRSGEVLSVSANAVHSGDEFKFAYGTSPFLLHRPHLGEGHGPVIAFYAVAQLRHGGADFVVLDLDEIAAARSRSRAPKGGPWETDFEAMGRKTAIRRLAKTMPMSAEFATAMTVDETTRTVSTPADIVDLDIPDDDVTVTADGEVLP